MKQFLSGRRKRITENLESRFKRLIVLIKKKADVLLGILIGFLFCIPIYLLASHSSLGSGEIINIIGILTGAIIAIFIAYVIQDSLTNRRSVKDYFVQEITLNKNFYFEFIEEIRNGKKNSLEINQEFKRFSVNIIQLDTFLKSEMEISASNLQQSNRSIHEIVTGSLAFNEQFNNAKVVLDQENIKDLLVGLKTFNHFCFDLIIKVNKI